MMLAIAAAILVVGGAIIGGVVVFGGGGGGGSKGKAIAWSQLPGLQNHGPPWNANALTAADRLPFIELTATQQEGAGVLQHIHMHLDIYVNGKHIAIPPFIGLEPSIPVIADLHTHAADGIIHLEAPTSEDLTLGQFFGVWGVKLTSNCLATLCGKLQLYVNGKPFRGDPASLVLKSHQQLALVFGKPPKNIPSSHKFARGE